MPEVGTGNLPNLAPSGAGSKDGVGVHHPPSAKEISFTDAQVDEFREQDRWLPIANVARIMKTSLPYTAKVSKDAKECVQECVSEFISFITSEAAEKCLTEKRKTINGEDILTSMRALGFDNYEGVLKVYLAKFREAQMQQARLKQNAEDDELKRSAEDDGSDNGPGEETKKRKRSKKKKDR